MPGLGDYLGALLGEVTNARLLADLETARVAQLYAAHPLLVHMPVPRFRLPTVTLDLPVAVDAVQQLDTRPAAAQFRAVRQSIDTIVASEFGTHGVRLVPNRQKALSTALNAVFDRLQAASAFDARSSAHAADEAATLVVEAAKSSAADRATVDPALESSVRRRLGVEFLTLQPPLPKIDVLVNAAQLKDVAPPRALTRIQLTISEEGVEWTQTNSSDASPKTLLPE